MPDDPMCTCGHRRSEHDEEMPYRCFGVAYDDDMYDDMCTCEGFEYRAERREQP